jgi:uncharacterized protein (DUF1499 family)
MRFSFVVFVSFILASTVPFFATEAVKEQLPMKTVAVCSSRPGCVSSVGTDKARRMPPFRFTGPVGAAQERLLSIIQQIPRSKILKGEPGYLAAIFSSKVFGFVDEAEFAFGENNWGINFFSGARSGYYDFGVNRSRIVKIRESFMEQKR